MIAGIIVMALVKLEVIDTHSQETITDILTMVFTGGGLLLYGIYEFWHVFLHKEQLTPEQQAVEEKKFYFRLFNWFKAKAFIEVKPSDVPQQ